MKIISNDTNFIMDDDCCVAIGKFDGIHIGHLEILRKLSDASKDGLRTVIFTFDPSPASFFSGKVIPELMTREEKRKIFEDLGVDYLYEYPLNEETASVEAETFIRRFLHEQLKARVIISGDDISFGKEGKGDERLLRSLSDELGYEVITINKVCIMGKTVSSTLVRNEVASGRMEDVTMLLGHPYRLMEKIVAGARLGRTIGMPTINMITCEGKLLPPNGVYYSRVWVNGNCYNALTNIGVKPTVKSDGEVVLESYLYDFEGDLYGMNAVVELLSFKRKETKFSGVEELAQQLLVDREDGKHYFSKKQ